MDKKICAKCKEEKDISEFHHNKSRKDGLQSYCISCRSHKSEEVREQEAERESLYAKGMQRCTKCNRILSLNHFKKDGHGWRGIKCVCKECIRPAIIKYGKSESYRNYQREYRAKWRVRNREKSREVVLKYARTEKGKRKILARAKRLDNRLVRNLRQRISRTLHLAGTSKNNKTLKLLGCQLPFFKEYLRSLWSKGMSWDNYGVGIGKWGIDHIIPCAAFDLTDPVQQSICFHFSNMMPLWCDENASKSSWFDGKKHHYNK